MGRILPSGIGFRQQRLPTTKRARQTQAGEVMRDVGTAIDLADKILGSEAVNAIVTGAEALGEGAAGLFADTPGETPEDLRSVAASQILQGDGFPSGLPEAEPPKVRGDRADVGAFIEAGKAAGKTPTELLQAIPPEVGGPRPAPPGAPGDVGGKSPAERRTARLNVIRDRIVQLLRDGKSGAAIASALTKQGAPPHEARALVQEAVGILAGSQATAGPRVRASEQVEEIRDALADGDAPETIGKQLIAQGMEPADAVAAIKQAMEVGPKELPALPDVSPQVLQAVPPPEIPKPKMEEIVQAARAAKTDEERALVLRDAARVAEPTTILDRITGAHKLRAALAVEKLFQPVVRAGKTPEEIASEIAGRAALAAQRQQKTEEAVATAPKRGEKLQADIDKTKAVTDKTKALKRKIEALTTPQKQLLEERAAKLRADVARADDPTLDVNTRRGAAERRLRVAQQGVNNRVTRVESAIARARVTGAAKISKGAPASKRRAHAEKARVARDAVPALEATLRSLVALQAAIKVDQARLDAATTKEDLGAILAGFAKRAKSGELGAARKLGVKAVEELRRKRAAEEAAAAKGAAAKAKKLAADKKAAAEKAKRNAPEVTPPGQVPEL